MSEVVVIGAGMGGLSAAIRAAEAGHDVQLYEARSRPGGLASRVTHGGMPFDAGPYILLDKPGLEWAFERLGVPLEAATDLQRIEEVYEVDAGRGPPVAIFDDLARTAERLEARWPGAGDDYREFVDWTRRVHERMRPLQWVDQPGVLDVLRTGAWRNAFFVLRSLASVLSSTGLPEPVRKTIGIWTHVAGQSVAEAPSVLAMVPSLIHDIGAYYPRGGIGALPEALAARAEELGVELTCDTRVERIRTENGAVRGVELASGETVDCEAVVSNYSGVGTYLELVDDIPARVERRLRDLPLQSPGVCAYLKVKGGGDPPYLRFSLPEGPVPCRLLIQPAAVSKNRDSWAPARLLSPLPHDRADEMSEAEQQAYLDELLEADWWRQFVDDAEVLAGRTAVDWGREFNLYADTMNPVMTARFMRRGRMAHRSPHVDGLYLAGSSTHPGQWVSFCAVSGIHAADALDADVS